MRSDVRPRSWLFVPGNRQRFIDKALRETHPDAVLLDLEDGVPPAEKPTGRNLVEAALAQPELRVKRYVRVNRAGSEWFDQDMEAILAPGLDGVCLPKVEEIGEIDELTAHLERFERAHDVALGSTSVLIAIESALGLLHAPELAASSNRVAGLIFGAEDFALDLGLATRRDREAGDLIYARSAFVVAATSAHVMSVDGVFPNLEDDAGLLADIGQARRLGFTGKSTFHPKQVDLINEAFRPTAAEMDYAQLVVHAFDNAAARGEGAVAVGGQLVDLPIVARAKSVLASAALGGGGTE